MFNKLLPKETGFFDLFDKHALTVVESAKVFLSLTADDSQIQSKVDQIKALELQADSITHQCLEALHRTFMTPFERDDIYRLASCMDDVIDEIDATADCLIVYKIKEMTPFVKDLAQVLLASTIEMAAAVKSLRDLGNSPEIRIHCQNISKLENDADMILRNALGWLFDKEPDTRMIIKWKEIYEHLESATDNCDDVANIIEGVILEYA